MKHFMRKCAILLIYCVLITTITPATTVWAEEQIYTVKSGDTLWSIAKAAYGDGALYTKIVEANESIMDPDLIRPGQKLLIPQLDKKQEKPIEQVTPTVASTVTPNPAMQTEQPEKIEVAAELDTYVHSKATDKNSCSDINIIIGKEREAVLKFDLTQIPLDAGQIMLRMYSYWGSGNEFTFSIIPEYDKVTDGITYDTMPEVGKEVGKFKINSGTTAGAKEDVTKAKETTLDVTEIIKAYRKENPEATKIVFHIANSEAKSCTEIRSMEHADGMEYAPTLCVDTKAESTDSVASAESDEIIIGVELDTYVHSKTTDKDACSDISVIIGKEREALLKFDITKIPEDAEQVLLRMYSYWGSGNEFTFSIIPEYDKVTDGITYDTMPEVGKEVGKFKINSGTTAGAKEDVTKAKETTLDVTEIIKVYRKENPEATKIVFHIANSEVKSCTEIRSMEHADGADYAAALYVGKKDDSDAEATITPTPTPFPLTADGVMLVSAELDTYVHSKTTDKNSCSDINIIIGKEREAVLKFDLTQIPLDAGQIMLRMYSYWGSGNEFTFSIIPEYDKVTDGITYDTMPEVGKGVGKFKINSGTTAGAKEDVTKAKETTLDVTEIIKAYRKENPEATKIVFHIANSEVKSCTEIRSAEHADGEAYAPTLMVSTKGEQQEKQEPAGPVSVVAELDTYVKSDSADANYNSDINIIIGKTRAAVLKFDLTQIPKDAKEILLSVYSYKGNGNNFTFSIVPEYDKVTEDITYNTMPAVGKEVGTFRINSSGNAQTDVTKAVQTEVDVTKIIKEYREQNPNAAKIVFYIANTEASSCTEIRSMEHADGEAYAPTLVVHTKEELQVTATPVPTKKPAYVRPYLPPTATPTPTPSPTPAIWVEDGGVTAIGVELDTYVQSDKQKTNYNDATNIIIGKTRAAVLKFDLTNIPSDAEKIYLRIYGLKGAANTFSFSIIPDYDAVTEKVTYNTLPKVGEVVGQFKIKTSETKIDVTEIIKTYMEQNPNATKIVFHIANTGVSAAVEIRSKEHTDGYQKAPALLIAEEEPETPTVWEEDGVKVIGVELDTYVQSNKANEDFDSAVNIIIGKERAALLKFDLKDIPSDAGTIYLRTYGLKGAANTFNFSIISDYDAVTNEITYNTLPEVGEVVGQFKIGTSETKINVTEIIRTYMEENPNATKIVFYIANTEVSNCTEIRSKEHSDGYQKAASLLIMEQEEEGANPTPSTTPAPTVWEEDGVKVIGVELDTYVQNDKAKTNYNDAANIIIGKTRAAVLKFDLTNIPSDAGTIYLRVYGLKGAANTFNFSIISDYDAVTNEITYNTLPEVGEVVGQFKIKTSETKINVTEIIRTYMEENPNATKIVFYIANTEVSAAVEIRSKEHADGYQKAASLLIMEKEEGSVTPSPTPIPQKSSINVTEIIKEYREKNPNATKIVFHIANKAIENYTEICSMEYAEQYMAVLLVTEKITETASLQRSPVILGENGVEVIGVEFDTYVQSTSPAKNYSDENNILIGADSEALLKFDIADIPLNAEKIELRIYYLKGSGNKFNLSLVQDYNAVTEEITYEALPEVGESVGEFQIGAESETPEPGEPETPSPTPTPSVWEEDGVKVIGAELDTYVHSKNKDTNFSADINIVIGKEREALFKFDLTQIPEDAEQILLRMYSYWGSGNEFTFSFIPDYDKVTEKITYNTMPEVGEEVGKFKINSGTTTGAKDDVSKAKKTQIDVTEIIKAYRTENPDATKIVFHIANSSVSSCTEIRSMEHADGYQYAAALLVTEKGEESGTPSVTPSPTPTATPSPTPSPTSTPNVWEEDGVKVIGVEVDTYVRSNEADNSFGSAVNIVIGKEREALLKFDLTQIPSDAEKIELRYSYLKGGSNTFSVSVVSDYDKVTNEVTYNALPDVGNSVGEFKIGTSESLLDVTEIIKAYRTENPDATKIVFHIANSEVKDCTEIRSKEHADGYQKAAALLVTEKGEESETPSVTPSPTPTATPSPTPSPTPEPSEPETPGPTSTPNVWEEDGVKVIGVELDTYVLSDKAGENHNAEERIIIGKTRAALLKFDLTQIPEDAEKIELRTYSYWGSGNEFTFSIIPDYDKVTDGITYDTMPEVGEEVGKFKINSDSTTGAKDDVSKAKETQIDVTEIIKAYRTENPDATKIVFHIANSSVSSCTEIRSMEHADGYQYAAALLVTEKGEESPTPTATPGPEATSAVWTENGISVIGVEVDTYVQSNKAAEPFGSAANIVIGKERAALLKFDLSNIPENVEKIELRTYGLKGTGNTFRFYLVSDYDAVTDEVTYNTLPEVGDQVGEFHIKTSETKIDVTEIIKTYMEQNPEATKIVFYIENAEVEKCVEIRSKEHEDGYQKAAALLITEETSNLYVKKKSNNSFELGINLETNTLLDTIILGDTESMSAHNVTCTLAIDGKDLYGSRYIRLKDSAHYLSFEVKVDPKKQNYVTVKFWGGETGSNSAMLLYGENAVLQQQDYTSDWPLLDYLGSEPELEGGYYYATYRIPLSMSLGKESVTLELRHFGSVDAYDANGDDIKYVETETASRAIHQICTHIDPYYTIQEEETVGLAKELDTTAVFTETTQINAYEFLLDKVNEATETIVSWQLYGSEFEANVAAGKIPELARGCLMTGVKASTTYDSMEAFASAYYSRVLSGNAEYMKMLYGMAVAYTIPENPYYESNELLERMVAAWDFYVRAQGNNGGFASDKAKWIGISSATGDGYDEEGRQAANTIIPAGEKAIAETFVLLYEAVEAAGMLDEAVDYNLDGAIDQETETRRVAYYKMFCEGTKFAFTYSNRECVNQDLLNLMMGYHFNKAAALLGEAVYSETTVMTRLYAGLGITEHLYTKEDGTAYLHGGYQFSVKNAIAMETFGSGAGGYCGNYGFNCSSLLYDFAHLTQDEALIEQAVKSADSLGYFIDYVMGSSGIAVMRKEDAINTRNLYMPGRVSYAAGYNNFLPVLYGSETAKRQLEIYLQSGSWYYDFPSLTNVHAADTYRHILDMLTEEGFRELLKGTVITDETGKITYEYDLNTDYIFPTEESYGDFVFADEMARVVVLRNGDDFIRMVLNWRMGYNGSRVYENATVNNVLRVHHTTSNSAYITTASMKSPYGFEGVYIAKYGPYTVIMNSSEDVTYEYTIVGDGEGVARNLATGEFVAYETALQLEPMSTVVIYADEGTPEVRKESAVAE